jgi:curved DNA-binding protein CbpA
MVVDRTLYDVLGVDPNATQQTISKVIIFSEFYL